MSQEFSATGFVEMDVELLRRRISTLEAALRGLVDKLTLVHADERYKAVWTLSMIHGVPYNGPQYKDELEIARKALGK